MPVSDQVRNMNINEGEESADSETPPKCIGGEYCPRCGKQVFIAEKKQAGGKVVLYNKYMYR